jgi:hypothetical protein
VDEETIKMLLSASGMGPAEDVLKIQAMQAQKLRDRAGTPRQYTTPGAALGGGISRAMDAYKGTEGMNQYAQGTADLAAQRQKVLSGLPTDGFSAPQGRALGRALTGTGDTTLAAVGKGYTEDSGAQEKGEMLHQRLVNTLVTTGMKLEQAKALADRAFYAPNYVNTPGDLNHSGVTTQRTPEGGIDITPVGTSKPPGMGGGTAPTTKLDPAALDNAAKIYEETRGQSMGKVSVRDMEAVRQVLNRHAEMFPDSDTRGSQADYKAGAKSLSDLTVSRNRLVAYERLLDQNIGVLEGTFKEIPNSNVMAINHISRAVARQLGNEGIAAFDTARAAVSREAARILYNPNLTGQLTNQAVADLEAVHSGDYSVAQLRSVIKIVRQEAGNRKSTLDSQIEEVKKGVARPTKPDRALPRATGEAPAAKRIKYDAAGNEVP